MNEEKAMLAVRNFITSVRHAYRGESIGEIQTEEAVVLAEKHYLVPFLYEYLPKEKLSKKIRDRLERKYHACIYADIEQRKAEKEIREYFLKTETKLMPLKGIRLKKIYPRPEMRVMSDLDILYEKKDEKKIKDGMKKIGYKLQQKSVRSNHLVFTRGKWVTVEMHSDLFKRGNEFFPYYKDIWNRAEKKDNGYGMSAEEEYIYLLAHAYKHFQEKGTGIRTILDFFYYKKAYKPNAEEIERNIFSKKLKKFNQFVTECGDAWFEREESEINIDEETVKLLLHGVYGSETVRIEKAVKEVGMRKYIAGRIFPPWEKMKDVYPVLRKLPPLLPVCWLARLIRCGIFSRKQIRMEISCLKKMKK